MTIATFRVLYVLCVFFVFVVVIVLSVLFDRDVYDERKGTVDVSCGCMFILWVIGTTIWILYGTDLDIPNGCVLLRGYKYLFDGGIIPFICGVIALYPIWGLIMVWHINRANQRQE